MEEKIKLLGDAFRGLWISRICKLESDEISIGWSVTFIYEGDYCETPNCDSHHDALDFAIKKLKRG